MRRAILLVLCVLSIEMPFTARADEPKLSPQQFETIWSNLTLSDDEGVKRAFKDIGTLIESPTQALAFLSARLAPVAAPDNKKIEQWIGELDSADFATREKATRELENMGALARPALQKKVDGWLPSLEVRRRMERILEKIDVKVYGANLSADELRATRAVEVLYGIGDEQARQLLDRLAKGAAGARLTEDARIALMLLDLPAGELPWRNLPTTAVTR